VQRGQLFRTPSSQQARAAYLRTILDWAYVPDRGDDWLEGMFWDCFLGAAPDEMRAAFLRKKSALRRHTTTWRWKAMQKLFRDGFEQVMGNELLPLPLDQAKFSRVISILTGPDGRRYWHYGPQANVALNEESIVRAALDEALCDLRGLAEDALGRCEQCSRYFVRVRAVRKRFCSPHCQWQASKARRQHARGQRRRREVVR
jgi:hypothetical protein